MNSTHIVQYLQNCLGAKNGTSWSQSPDFTAAAVLGNGEIVDNFNFAEFTKGKKAVVFFYPLDFTFVCHLN